MIGVMLTYILAGDKMAPRSIRQADNETERIGAEPA